MASRTPLARQLVLLALAGGLVVAVVTAALAVPLVRSVAREQVRTQLVRAVDALAAKPQVTARLLIRERRTLGPDDRTYSLMGRGGQVVGPAGSVLDPSELETLRTRGTLSTTAQVDGEQVLVEGRLTRTGRGAIGIQPVAEVDQATAALVRRIALALLVGLLLAGALGVLVARRIARPVVRTAEAARRLAAGERGLAVADSRLSEVSEMSHALAALDAALAASEGRQREFLLSISHELRTPLTAVRGYAEALRDGAVPVEEVPRVGAVLSAETERLDRFVADLLALARLEADDFRLQRVPMQLAPVLEEVRAAWSGVAANVGITLRVQGDGGLEGDPFRVRQVLDGLVENALRATPAGGQVGVRGEAGGDLVVLRVEDTGPGLAAGEHEHAFDRGRLRDVYAGTRPVGTGLGLSLAHRLTERMGGDIAAAPALEALEGGGGGTVITVRLPRHTSTVD